MSRTTEFVDLAESYGDKLKCRQSSDPGAWFAEPGSKRQSRAKEACQDCPLFEQCGSYALRAGIPAGVWGGMDEADRLAIWAGWPNGKPTDFLDDIDAALAVRITQQEEEEVA